MKMVYSNENSFLVNNVKNIIEAQGIQVFIKNEYAQGAVGEISAFDSWPELWVVNDSDVKQAELIIKTNQNQTSYTQWICNNCCESNDASFELCWKCQKENT
ncbi:DUF2007 domain-containing protein [Litorilituus lipolyticus]|uniref:DUF2007 domain-containing protein n=1 Tax=Litorilituus lipolyticus TaxID=2491017 RepID=A0A502KSB6_9GAMM|nr:DUF2007 domain-containing protein [Litorilituus lipolyticus]TPH14620.1 DUF2007 domain-containing protein [Litorilituus lipolyticus]